MAMDVIRLLFKPLIAEWLPVLLLIANLRQPNSVWGFVVVGIWSRIERRVWVYILVTKEARKQTRNQGKEERRGEERKGKSYGGSFGFGWPGANGMLFCDKQQEVSDCIIFCGFVCGILRQLLGFFGASLQCESLCFWKATESSGPSKLLHFAVHGFQFLGWRRCVQFFLGVKLISLCNWTFWNFKGVIS